MEENDHFVVLNTIWASFCVLIATLPYRKRKPRRKGSVLSFRLSHRRVNVVVENSQKRIADEEWWLGGERSGPNYTCSITFDRWVVRYIDVPGLLVVLLTFARLPNWICPWAYQFQISFVPPLCALVWPHVEGTYWTLCQQKRYTSKRVVRCFPLLVWCRPKKDIEVRTMNQSQSFPWMPEMKSTVYDYDVTHSKVWWRGVSISHLAYGQTGPALGRQWAIKRWKCIEWSLLRAIPVRVFGEKAKEEKQSAVCNGHWRVCWLLHDATLSHTKGKEKKRESVRGGSVFRLSGWSRRPTWLHFNNKRIVCTSLHISDVRERALLGLDVSCLWRR